MQTPCQQDKSVRHFGVLWNDESQFYFYQSDGKAHTSLSVKHNGGNIIPWSCVVATRISPYIKTNWEDQKDFIRGKFLDIPVLLVWTA